MDDKTKIAMFGMGCITAMEIVAIATLHIDGAMLSGVVGTIAGIVGYAFGIRVVKGGENNAIQAMG